MSPLRFPVAVIFQRTELNNRWVNERWEPIAVVPPVVLPVTTGRDTPIPVKISDSPSSTRWRFDGHAFELHPCEAEGYYLNLAAPDPKAFVMWRMTEEGGDPPLFPVIVTVSYNEAARMLDEYLARADTASRLEQISGDDRSLGGRAGPQCP